MGNIIAGCEKMSISKKEYSDLVKRKSPPSPKLKNGILAFVVGGAICMTGQLLIELYGNFGLTEKQIKMAVPSTLIFFAAVLTALGVFDKIAKRAGAGTLVPITGFANSVVSPAIEFKNEGWILGVGAKIFQIAGPVIAYGTAASVVYGIIYWVTTIL